MSWIDEETKKYLAKMNSNFEAAIWFGNASPKFMAEALEKKAQEMFNEAKKEKDLEEVRKMLNEEEQ